MNFIPSDSDICEQPTRGIGVAEEDRQGTWYNDSHPIVGTMTAIPLLVQ